MRHRASACPQGRVVQAEGLGAPQGLVAHGDDLVTVDVEHRRLWSVSPTTGERRVEAEDLVVVSRPRTWRSACPGRRAAPRSGPLRPRRPRTGPRFAGLAAAPDGSLLLSSNGEGTVLRPAPNP
ncbi:hypothetical protein [Streptomyces sp. NEAU-H22]|uniref:hypothetical protein n=1 Tax=Streptomyces sp. NEAU-H22 TaxID=2994655 RepID=UPI002B1CDF7F|nr:hypothetical protein [Streptomyces sp. NEAU-H22]